MGDGRLGRHHALAAHDLGLALLHRVEDQRHVAAGAAEMRLDHLQGEGGGDAASKALPPRSRMPMPTAVAIQWVEATTPKVPTISGRVVKGLGLISFTGDLLADLRAEAETLSPTGRGG